MDSPAWATQAESEEDFKRRMDEQWEAWWNSMPHAVRFPTDNDPED
jgi:hypothetical protein